MPLKHDARAALAALGYPQHAGREVVILQGPRGPMTPRGVQALLARYEALARLDDLSPHALRHTFCKNLIDAGGGLEQVTALAGLESLETTPFYQDGMLLANPRRWLRRGLVCAVGSPAKEQSPPGSQLLGRDSRAARLRRLQRSCRTAASRSRAGRWHEPDAWVIFQAFQESMASGWEFQ